jgi:arylsulfatase
MKIGFKTGVAATAAVLVALLSACGSSTPPAAASTPRKPNVLVILVDDLGYSDISAFGSEIATPNIDRLAAEGRVLTNFHTTPLCATSRAELLTGTDHHRVGVGTLYESSVFYPGDDEYAGQLNDQALTVAQMLHDAGYHSYMAGKWHLGGGGPATVGFEQSFSMDYTEAFGNNFKSTSATPASAARTYYENGVAATLPDDFFSSDYFVDRLQQYIGHDHGDGRPFFAYLAFQAVHFPLQAPDAYLDRYKGRYDAGYAVIRAARLAKQKQLGLVPQDFAANPGDEAVMVRFGQPGVLTNTAWDSLSAADKQSEARIMEVFAAMLTNVDDNVGRLTDYLKSIGEYDNTLILFTGDNGADGMGYGFIPYVDSSGNTDIDNSLANYGRPGSFIFRSTRWAEAGTVPFRLFKAFTAEGGLSVPTIVRLPSQSTAASPSAALSTLRDVVPTILDLAGVVAPGAQYQGHSVATIEGRSLMPVLHGQAQVHPADEVIADEVNDIRYVRRGPWKLTRVVNYLVPSAAANINHDWQLYDMDHDRGETLDLAAQYPDVVAALTDDWRAYVTRVGVKQPILPPLLTPLDQ